MIADLGLSKQLGEINSNSKLLGMPAYIEPQCYINSNYKRNEKSDIYSLGVLFWEISSGKPPFSEIPQFNINLKIVNRIRETPIKNTPFEYQQLYENCWKEEPNQRPNIDKVYKEIIQLKLQFDNENKVCIIQDFNDLNINNNSSLLTDTSCIPDLSISNTISLMETYSDSNLENLILPSNNNQNGKVIIYDYCCCYNFFANKYY